MATLTHAMQFWFARMAFNAAREDFYKELALAIEHDEHIATFLGEEIEEARKYKEHGPILLYKRMLRRMDEEQGRFSHMLDTMVPKGDLFALSAIDEVDKTKKVEGLRFLAQSVMRVRQMAGLVFSALQTLLTMLPVFLAFAIINAVVVIPEFEQMLPLERWPAIGKSLYWVSYVIRHYWYALIVLAVGGIWGFLHSLDHWYGPTRAKADKRFPYSLYRDFHGSIFLIRLAQLLQTDYSLNEALLLLRSKAVPWMGWHITRMLRNMTEYGQDYSQIINTGIFSRRMQKRVSAYARRSGFKDALVEVGGSGMDAVMDDIRRAAGRLNKISLVFCVAGLCYFHFGMQYTTNDLISQMKQESAVSR
ncbi:hypothetical protein [Cupriavidus sp. TMH.W2]|uniref:hypothetical protein n=1 Tax=Cupriavidus sp. TMH.W2 TaxID=3434465 RepID=UPI003D77A19C